MPAKSDSDVMFCLHCYQGLRIDISLVSYFQRCIVMRLFYFSYKQVKHEFSLLRAYAIICGRFNITVN